MLAFLYVFIVYFLFQNATGRRLLMVFYAVGRMGLTTYLSQTIIGIFIFYGIGFGLLGVISPASCLLLALGFYSLQILFSNWWMHRFQYGIVEWLWRCLTFFRFSPLRKKSDPHSLKKL